MTDGAVFVAGDNRLSPCSDINITIEEGPENCEDQLLHAKSSDLENAFNQVLGIDRRDLENDTELTINCVDLGDDGEPVLEFRSNEDIMLGLSDNDNSGNLMDIGRDDSQGKSYLPPVIGMEFDSYEDAYNYYNSYAKEVGFGIRVKSSWTKRNSKEKRGAVLCCNCEGFKTMKEASSRRKETRSGCLAMIRLRLVESNRWRLDEVKLEHNHFFDHEKAQSSKSHKKMEAGMKRKLDSVTDVEIQTIKLYQAPAVNVKNHRNSKMGKSDEELGLLKRLNLGKDGAQTLFSYFREVQLTDPNFFYITDLSDEGYVRNVLWVDSRSRASYGYFGDVVFIDTTCLSNNHNFPLVVFTGLNHHGESVLLGCSLLVDESIETYTWLMRTWLTCMTGRTPQTILTSDCKALRSVISEVFPRTQHRLFLPLILQSIEEKLGESEVFRAVLNRSVYNSLTVEEFETHWEEMVQHFGIADHGFMQSLFKDREKWALVYSKETPFSGIYDFQQCQSIHMFFQGYLHKETSLSEFFNIYESVQQEKIHKEACDDIESREFHPVLKTTHSYELQISEVYTKEIFLKFQEEILLMTNCFNVTKVLANGPIAICIVKEQAGEGDLQETKDFEVTYDGIEARCICNCFNLRGYLCRHALTVLGYNSIHEIPSQYILSRWRKDLKRFYSIDPGSNNIDVSNPVQWFDHLYRRAMQVVGEGMMSHDHHKVALQVIRESLSKIRSVVPEKHG